jgi:tetratricopeptide (TPR) repeat protein
LNLAKIRQDAGQADAASEILREARARFPDNWDLVKFETTLLRGRSENVRALAFAEAFAQERWWHLDARLTLAECRAANQDFAGAREALATAARLDIYDTRALLLLTQLELQLNRPDEALVAQVTAMEREPGQPKHYVGLSAILDRLGRHPESRGAIRKAELLVAEARGL